MNTKPLYDLITKVENSPWGNAQPDARVALFELEKHLTKLEDARKKLREALESVNDKLCGQDVFADAVLLDARVDEVLHETR